MLGSSTAPSRPTFVNELLARPLPPLQPSRLTDSSNPPHSFTLKAAIADARLHPLVEVVLHLMNDDLFSAHFLLRKLQENGWGKWLHGILHAREGDMRNAKCWYRDTPASLLGKVYTSDGVCGKDMDAHTLASHALDRLSLAIRRLPPAIRSATDESGLAAEEGEAFTESQLVELARKQSERTNQEACKHLWNEMRVILEHLENDYGWEEWDGSYAYTRDSHVTKEKGRVLGEGWRTF